MLNSSKIYKFLFTLAMGLAAGFLCGMLGAGGGILIVYALSRLLGEESRSGGTVFANSLAVLLPLALVTSVSYIKGGLIDFAGLMPLVPSSVIGGILGGFLLGKISGRVLKLIFALVVIISGLIMIV
jgi:uncharacterized membrane protein YfcA